MEREAMQRGLPASRASAAVRAAILAVTLSSAPAWSAEMELLAEHGDWSSFAFRDRHDARYRAMAVQPHEGTMVALAFDRYPGGCDALYASMLITLPAPATRSMAVMDDAGLARVDELPIRPIRFNAVVREGGSLIVAEIGKLLGGGDFVDELRRGGTVRFKLGTEHRTYFVHFSLAGFTAAIRRTLALCRESERLTRTPLAERQPVPRGAEDRDYFGE